MGYTHYWYRPAKLGRVAWGAFTADVAAILREYTRQGGEPLAWEYDEPGRGAQIDHNAVRFNGVGEAGHETFLVSRVYRPYGGWDTPEDGRFFQFCKTAEKPYDRAVTACLMALERHYPGVVRLSSDGELADWDAGRDLLRAACGYEGIGVR